MEKITSTQNPVIRSLKALKDAKERAKTGLFLVEGEVMIKEALKCGLTPKEALFENESPLMNALKKAGANVHLCSRSAHQFFWWALFYIDRSCMAPPTFFSGSHMASPVIY